jgi:hypothetical protein
MSRAQLHGSLFVGVLVTGLGIAVGPPPASAQPAAGGTAKQRIVIDRAKVVPVVTKAPIAHVPFPMVDPQTSKPVAPTQILVGPKGEKVSAQAYWDNVNKFEKYLNDRGLSQRTSAPINKIEQLHEDDALIAARATKIAARQKPTTPAVAQFQAARHTPPSPADVQHHLAILVAQSAAVPYKHGGAGGQMVNPDRIVEKTITRSWPFGASIGGDFFGAEFGGEERAESHEFHRTVTNSAHANASVFGKAISLVDAQIIAKSAYSESYGGSGSAETDFTVTLQGVQPFAPVQVLSPKKSELYMDRKTLATTTWSPDFPGVSIGAGPYSIDITVTLAAHADIDAAYNVLGSSARADLMPASSLNVAVSAGISFPGIEIGVDGRMRVFDHHFELANQAELIEPGREAKLALTNSGTDRFDALSGALSLFIKVGWGIFSHRFDVDIFSKTGNHDEAQFLATNETVALMPPAPPPPPSPLATTNAPAANAPAPPSTQAASRAPAPPSTAQGSTRAPAPRH